MAQKNTDILSLSPVLSDSRTALRQLHKDIAILEDTLNKSGGLRLNVTLNEQQLQQQIKNAVAQITTAFQNTVSSKNLSGRYSTVASAITRSDSGVSASLQKMFSEQQISISNLVRQQERLLSISSALTSAENQRLALLREQNNLLSTQNSNSISNNFYTAKAKNTSLPTINKIENQPHSEIPSDQANAIKGMNYLADGLSIASDIPALAEFAPALKITSSIVSFASKIKEEQEKVIQASIQKAYKLENSYDEKLTTISSNKQALTSLQDEFNKLSQGVDTYGRNISLSSEQLERYQQIVNQIVSVSPSLVAGFDAEGNAIARKNDLLEKAIKLQNQEYRATQKDKVSSANLKTTLTGYVNEYRNINNHKGESFEFSKEDAEFNMKYEFYRGFNSDINSKNYEDKRKALLGNISNTLGIENAINTYTVQISDGTRIFEGESYTRFWEDNKDAIADNIDEIISNLEKAGAANLGMTEEDFKEYIKSLSKAADIYLPVKEEADQLSDKVSTPFKEVAQANDNFVNLTAEQVDSLNHILSNIDIKDVSSSGLFSADPKLDAKKVDAIRTQVNNLTEAFAEVDQQPFEAFSSLQSQFENGTISIEEYKNQIGSLQKDFSKILGPIAEIIAASPQLKEAFDIPANADANNILKLLPDKLGVTTDTKEFKEVENLMNNIKSKFEDENFSSIKDNFALESMNINELRVLEQNFDHLGIAADSTVEDIKNKLHKLTDDSSLENIQFKVTFETEKMQDFEEKFEKFFAANRNTPQILTAPLIETTFAGASDTLKDKIADIIQNTETAEQALVAFKVAASGELLDLQDKAAKIQFKDAFGDSLNFDTIDSWDKFSAAIQKTTSAANALKTAQEEYNQTGSISLSTALGLISQNENFSKVLDFQNGKITLVKDAEKQLVEVQIEAIKASLQNRKTMLEQKIAALELSFGTNTLTRSLFMNTKANSLMSLSSLSELEKENLQKELNDLNQQLEATENFDINSLLSGSGSGGAASSSVDVYKEAFDKEYKALKHNLDMELITNQTYYDELNSLNQKYFANRKKYLDEYRQYELELYELQKTLSRNRIDDIQHEIDMLARQDTFGGTSQTAFAQIEKYAAIQNEIHAQAERARSHGVDANNDYLQELQTQWWEYADKSNEVYQKILDDADRNTAHQAELIERNEWDADGKERIAMYISMQEQVAREAERYRTMGYQDTSEEIQNLQKQWWGYRDSILEVYDDIYEKYKDTVEKRLNISSGIVDKESSKLSYLKSQFDKATTTEAQKVYANDIYNSANDQLWEAKQAQIRNTENVNQERERFAQLLSETGIQYSGTFDELFNIDGSVNNGAAESVRQMIQSIGNPDAYTKLFESILDAGSQGKTKWKETSDEIDNTLSLLQSLQDSYIDEQQKAFDLVVDMLRDRYDKEREFAEKMHEEELDRLDERRKIIEDTYNRQISLLDDLKTEEDYNLALGKEQDAETALIREIEKYSMIDTQAARTKVSELQKQLQEQQDKIAQMQRDKEYSDKKKALEEDRDLLLDNLDEKVEAENESYDELLKRLEDYYDEKNLYQQAQAALESGYINLFKEESIKSYDDVGKYGADTALKLTDAFKEYYTATGTMADQIALNENARILNSYKDICVQVDTLTKKLDKLRQQGFGADGLKGNTFDAYEEKINRLKTDGAYATQEILRTQNKITALEASGDDTSEQYAYLKLVAGMEKTRTLEVIKQRKAAENPKDRDITEQVDYLRFIVGILGEPMPKYHTGRMAAWLNTEEEHAILKTDETVLTRPVTEGLLSKLRKIDLLDGIFHTAALPYPAVVGNPAHSFAGIGDVNITIHADGTPDKRMLKSFGNDILSRLKVEIEKVR